jgi:glucosylceramidase
LDEYGGPNWVSNTVDGSIIVNVTNDEFYKQPMFYALAHFSKFVLPGSKRIQMQTDDNKGISSAAFLREDGNVAIVFLNRYTLLLLLIIPSNCTRFLRVYDATGNCLFHGILNSSIEAGDSRIDTGGTIHRRLVKS